MHIHLLLVVLLLGNSIDTSLSASPEWNYGELGPDVWKASYPTCGGSYQSPINIKSACTTYRSFEPFQFTSAYASTQGFRLTNNGHTISGTQVNSSAFPLTLTGGGLSEAFTFLNFHLHWGENYNSGSEHQLNGQKYAGEIHFVHINSAKTLYAVLGVFIQSSASINSNNTKSNDIGRKRRQPRIPIDNTDNSTSVEWGDYFDVAGDLNRTNSSTVASLKLSTLMGTNLNNFYRYSGSLTTPPCSEAVTWTVYEVPTIFTELELESFRSNIYSKDYRDLQPINGRTVYRNFPNATSSAILDYTECAQTITTTEGSNTVAGSLNRSPVLFINKQLLSYSFVFLLSYFLM